MTLEELLKRVPDGWHDTVREIDNRASVAALMANALGVTRARAYQMLWQQELLEVLEWRRD